MAKNYKNLLCPTCGNEIAMKETDNPQKCYFCKCFYKVKVTHHKGGRVFFEPYAVEAPKRNVTPRVTITRGHYGEL